MRKIELLAPAKDYDTAVDAIDCGADAVYIGGAKFGARYTAGNSLEDIRRTVEYAHRYGVRVYATLNTLLFDDELEEAERLAKEIIKRGVDALIVQDMAYCRMDLPIELHASTQTNCATPERVKFFEDAGFARAILERSLSLEEIKAISKSTNIELEAFVHGAICVGHSGRCFLSRSMSERSGNRGACTQPCRLPYDLTDAERNIIIKGKHLLSVRDLDLSARLGEMLDAGVTSFKIEGRLKERSYVRNIVSHYRRLLDLEIAKRSDLERASVGTSRTDFTPDPAKSFTRGGSVYMFDGKVRGVASFDTPKAVGESVGKIAKIDRRGIILDRKHDLATGDGVCFIAQGALVGTSVVGIEGERVQLNRYDGVEAGLDLFRNYNRLFTQAVERSRIKRTIAVDLKLEFENDKITLTATDEQGITTSHSVDCPTEEALNKAKGEEALRRQLSRSGDTIFEVRNISIENLRFAPMSVIAELRRDTLDSLEQSRVADYDFEQYLASFIDSALRHDSKPLYPTKQLAPQDNVTNRLAREFYAECGVEHIAAPLELSEDFGGECVMVSSYCIRREIGQCLLKNPTLRGDLFIEHGTHRYRLEFDCAKCEMRVVSDGQIQNSKFKIQN